MTHITPQMACDAFDEIRAAQDSISYMTAHDNALERLDRHFRAAAAILGYRLERIAEPTPESTIHDNWQELREQVEKEEAGYAEVRIHSLADLELAAAGNSVSLYSAFGWCTSPQGHNYWAYIFCGQTKMSSDDLTWLNGLLEYEKRRRYYSSIGMTEADIGEES